MWGDRRGLGEYLLGVGMVVEMEVYYMYRALIKEVVILKVMRVKFFIIREGV